MIALSGLLFFYCLPAGRQVRQSENIGIVKERNYAQIMFAGDLMFDRGIRYSAKKNGGNDFIFSAKGGNLSGLLAEQDLVVANLEGPITSEKSISTSSNPESPQNYFFTFDPSVAKTLYEKNIRLVSLGNNHILNFGKKGLAETQNYLDTAGVNYFGVPGGARSIVKEINGIKIAFVNYNEFIQDARTDAVEALSEIKKLRKESDIVVVFCHWGAEYVGPDLAMKNLAHNFIDSGADLVIGAHSHISWPVEIYKEKRIYYSLGNFIFDQYFQDNVRRGLGVVVKIDKQTKQMDFLELNFYLESTGQTSLR